MNVVKGKSRFEFPEDLKPGNFVAVCSHFVIENDVVIMSRHPYWGEGGTAQNDDGGSARFDRILLCHECASNPYGVGFRRAKFFGGKLNTGWWAFDTKPMGRPRKKK